MLSNDIRGLAAQLRQVGPAGLASQGLFSALILNLESLSDQAAHLERAGRPAEAERIGIPLTPDWMHLVRAVRA